MLFVTEGVSDGTMLLVGIVDDCWCSVLLTTWCYSVDEDVVITVDIDDTVLNLIIVIVPTRMTIVIVDDDDHSEAITLLTLLTLLFVILWYDDGWYDCWWPIDDTVLLILFWLVMLTPAIVAWHSSWYDAIDDWYDDDDSDDWCGEFLTGMTHYDWRYVTLFVKYHCIHRYDEPLLLIKLFGHWWCDDIVVLMTLSCWNTIDEVIWLNDGIVWITLILEIIVIIPMQVFCVYYDW